MEIRQPRRPRRLTKENVMFVLVDERPGIVRIGYDADLQAVIITWWKNDNSLFREMMEIELRLLSEHHLVTLIIDTSEVTGVLNDENQQWLAENLNPRLAATGLRQLLAVVPRSAIANLSNRRSFREQSSSFAVREVASLDDARRIAADLARAQAGG